MRKGDKVFNIFQEKREIRNSIEKQRRQLSKAWVESNSCIIIDHLKKLQEFQSAQTIHCYVAWRNEVNTHGLIKELLQKGHTVVVPVVDLPNRTLVHSKIRNFGDLQAGSFGILEPRKDRILPITVDELKLIIVPGIAFDLMGHRIGFGGGYYDEFLRQVKAPKIALAFAFQIVEKIPISSQDQRVDIIVSEKGVHRINDKIKS
ncbi:MAG: 5-formyltetrahydrofolate cyclo-ligase [bacterium]